MEKHIEATKVNGFIASELLVETRNKLLDIKNRTAALDPLVVRAIDKVKERYLANESQGKTKSAAAQRTAQASQGSKLTTTDIFLAYARREGIGASVLKLTTSLNKTRMDETSRVLLATPGVYESILLKMFRDDDSDPKDVEGVRPAVLLAAQEGPRELFYEELLKAFRSAQRLSIPDGQPLYDRFLDALVSRGVPLTAGKTAAAMKLIFEEVQAEGDLRFFVDQFAERGEIDAARFTRAIRQSMVDYLESIGIQGITQSKFNAGDYDEYFVQAYDQAFFSRNGGPISATITTPVPPAAAEFLLPTYEFLDEQGVTPASIHASAALYQMFFIGDKLGLFEMPNALLLRRAHGTLDLPSGPGSQLLQAYRRMQRNNNDVPPEERMLLYKRVFNLGGGKVLEDTAVNPEFPDLWDTLAREVTNYITRTEMSDAAEERISRAAIDEAIQNLQGNLSFYAADIDEDVRLMQDQYLLAERVLRDQQIMASIGLVRRQTLQAAIERLLAEDHGDSPTVRKLFKLGTKGQEILHFIADYDSSTPEDEFQRFLRLMEAWIVARGSLKDEDLESQEEESEDEDEFGDDESDEQDEEWEI